MTIYYSHSLKGFIDDRLIQTPPADAIEITEAEHIALLEGQSEGKVIDLVNGAPVLVDLVITTTWDGVRRRRNALLTASDWTQLADVALTDAQKLAWTDYRQALRNIPEDFGDPDAIVWPDKPA